MFQNFHIENLENFPQRLESLLQRQKQRIEELAENDSVDYEAVIKPMEEMDEERSLFFTPLSHLNSVMNSEATQKAYEASLPLLLPAASEPIPQRNLTERSALRQAQSDPYR